MEYNSIRGKYLRDYSNKYTWNILHSYVDSHSQRLIYEYTGDGLQYITRLTLSDKRSYNRLFQKVVNKGGES